MADDGPTIVSLVPTTLQRLLDAGLREPPALRWALLGGAPATPRCRGARPRRACRWRRPTADRGVLAGHHARRAAVLHARAHGRRRRDPRQRADGRAGRRPCWPPATWASGARRRAAVAGRKADTIISGGENVAPAEVEAVLEAHPDVVEAAVHGRADPEWGEAVVATVVPTADLEAEELRAWCAERLATVQGAQGDRLHGGAAAHAVGQARTKGPADERRARRADRPLGHHGRRLEGDASQLPARDGAGLAVARGGDPPAAGAQRARAGGGPRRHRAAGRAARRARREACSSPTARRTWSPRRASTPRRSGRRTSNYGPCRPSGSTSRRRPWTASSAASATCCCSTPRRRLRETRRVLKPGGRVALAVWDELERNPWMKVVREALVARGLAPAAVPDGPGPFSLGSEEAVAELLRRPASRTSRSRRWTSSWAPRASMPGGIT